MTHNSYYSDPKAVNLDKLRSEAVDRTKRGEGTVIHYHQHLTSCGDKIHEYFDVPKEGEY